MRTLFVAFTTCVCLHAQEFRASIAGTVTDSSGSAVPGAKVVVTNIQRNSPEETETNDSGRYVLQFLIPGQYTVMVEKAGFKTAVKENIRLASSDRAGIDFILEVGAVADSVTVAADAPRLDTETASRTTLVEKQYVDNIATSGRNLYQLQYVQPGVIKNSSYYGDFELYATGNMNGVMINGGRSGQNETLLDGLPNTRSDSGVTSGVALNAVEEVTVVKNAYDAQYGRFGGGVTSITLRSGTNDLHGQLFCFVENDKFYATPWAANALGLKKTPFKQNTFGFTLDGPVVIPKVVNGRNKLFWMLSLEALRESNPQLQEATLPTAEQLQGDFSKLTDNSGRPITIFDPVTTTLGPDGRYTRQAFPGNRIPQGRINPVAANIASYYPQPNRPPLGLDGRSNYVVVNPAKNSYDGWLGKVDYRPTERHGISFRYGQIPWENFAQVLWGTNAAEPSGEAPSTRISKTWGSDWTYTISPTILFNLRAGLARYEGFSGNVYAAGFDPRQLGFPDSLVQQFTTSQFPRFNIGTYAPIGAVRATQFEAWDTYSLQPNVSWIRGKHTWKFGAEYRLYNQNRLQPGSATGNYTFDRRWTQANPAQADALSGNDFASFLLGHPVSGFVDRNIDPAYQNNYYVLYFQDDWKIGRNLTLNLGLRWDFEGPRKERYDRMVYRFAFEQPSPIANQVEGLTLKGGLEFASADRRLAFEPDRNNFQPRVGIAWQPSQKWVIRGGYGLTYLANSANGPDTGYSSPTTLVASTDNNITPAVTLSDPFPRSLFPNGLLQPIGSSQGLATNLGQAISAQYRPRGTAMSHQYSFGLQRELPWNFRVDLSYVGNATSDLPVNLNLNFIPATTLTSLPLEQRAAYFSTQVPNPMRGLLPGSAFNGNTIPRQQTLYAYPHFGQVSILGVPIGSQRYDAFQAKVERRFKSGLALSGSYTFGKTLEEVSTLNAQDVNLNDLLTTGLERRLSEYDVAQAVGMLMVYELPFGRGRQFANGVNKWTNALIGGWTVTVQHLIRTGHPYAFPNAAPLAPRSAEFSDEQRDTLAQSKGRQQFDPVFDTWFDTSLFPRGARNAYDLQTFPTRFPDVRSKALSGGEVSVQKNFNVTEKVRFQLRMDMQNAYNYPWFSRIASVNVTASNFGLLNPSPNSEAREIVLSAKILF